MPRYGVHPKAIVKLVLNEIVGCCKSYPAQSRPCAPPSHHQIRPQWRCIRCQSPISPCIGVSTNQRRVLNTAADKGSQYGISLPIRNVSLPLTSSSRDTPTSNGMVQIPREDQIDPQSHTPTRPQPSLLRHSIQILNVNTKTPRARRKRGTIRHLLRGPIRWLHCLRARKTRKRKPTGNPTLPMQPPFCSADIFRNQIVIYVFARVVLSLAKLSMQPSTSSSRTPSPIADLLSPETRALITDNAWTVFASVSWAAVMYLFRWYPDTIQPSLRSSMKYMYVETSGTILW